MLSYKSILLSTALLYANVHGSDEFANSTDDVRHSYNAGRRLSVGYLVFNGYTPLDVWGPLSILTALSSEYNMTLSIISEKAGPVSSTSPASSQNKIRSSMIATHTLQDAPRLNLLMVPGGTGSESWMEQFISARFDDTDYIASVCTGAHNLAKAGVLNGKRATTNKFAWASVVQYGENVTWVPSARWVHDGKVWTSSGVAAGIDMTYALLSWLYGSDRLNATMNRIELAPHTDEHWDPYSVVHKVPGADTTRPLKDLVGPVGYD